LKMDWNLYISFLVAMLSIVNPIGIVPMWSELTGDLNIKARRRTAFMLVITAIIILLIFLVAGRPLLNFFFIDLPVFRIAGGILLLNAGLEMVGGSGGKQIQQDEKDKDDRTIALERYKKILVPLAIPRLAGPGSIATVILFASDAVFIDYFLLAAVIVLVMALLFFTFVESGLIEKRVDMLVFNILTKLFGIILAAIAIQFVVQGLFEVFPNWVKF
jgi:multiple antibiotic resistance protein